MFTKNIYIYSLVPGVLIIVSRCKYKIFFFKIGINRDPHVHKRSPYIEHLHTQLINSHEHIRETRLTTDVEIDELNTCTSPASGMYQLVATKRIISCKCEHPC